MAHPSKIATCCHCGTRAMLQLDAGHHTLTCGACGAPLQRMKVMPAATAAAKPAVTHQPQPAKLRPLPKAAKPRKPAKKRKSLFRKFAEEAFDLVEDIFD